MTTLRTCILLGLTAVAAATGRADGGSDAELARLRARIEQLEAQNKALRDEVARLKGELSNVPGGKSKEARLATDVRLLSYLDKALAQKPGDAGVRLDAAALASRLAPELPGHPLVWRILLRTGTLKDGMPLADAEKLLGPPTERSAKHVGWYFNPNHRHVAPYLHARVARDGLSDWKMSSR